MEIFGRYELLKKLATGGMGQIYLARQKGPVGFQKLLVVKRILPHLSEEEEFIKMFFDEARIAALLNHPNIAQLYDLGEVDGVYYIAMEYVHGHSLRQLAIHAQAQQGGIPLGLKLRIIADAASGLNYAHQAKSPSGRPLAVIHRDVSPQNVLVGFNGSVKLIDFGVAKATNKVSHTMAGAIKGKYPYMSPEQATGDELDPRSDVFCLGILLHELLTHARLFKRENDNATLKAVVGAKVAPPSESAAQIPPDLDAIVLKALAKRREERFQTAGHLQLALEDFLVQHRLPGTSAHLAGFMRELYSDQLQEEKFAAEPTQIHFELPSSSGRMKEASREESRRSKSGASSRSASSRSASSRSASRSKRK